MTKKKKTKKKLNSKGCGFVLDSILGDSFEIWGDVESTLCLIVWWER